MHYFIYPKKDATIYSEFPSMNTGTDQIIELSKTMDGPANFITRILMQFDTASMKVPSASAALKGKSTSFYLNLFSSKAFNLPIDYTIEVYAVSQSWTMGSGKYYDSPETRDGASWLFTSDANAYVPINWASGSDTKPNVTGSSYHTGSVVSQSFSFEDPDPRIDVTSIVNSWLNRTYQNYGFLLKRTDTEELDALERGRLNFYSTDTNTVYLPTLEVVWDDTVFITGSTQYVMSGSYLGSFFGSSSAQQYGLHSGVYIGDITSSYQGSYQQNVPIISSSVSSSQFASINFGTYSSGSISASLYNGYISGTFINVFVSSSNFTGSIVNFLTGSQTGSLGTNSNISSSLSGSLSGSLIGTIYTSSFSGFAQLYMSGTFAGLTDYSYVIITVLTGSLTGSITGQVDGYMSSSFLGIQTGSLEGAFSPVLSGSSFEPLLSDQLSIMMKNLKPQYKYQTQARIRFTGKDVNQRKTFSNVPLSNFSIIKYLPEGTKYSIVDAYSGRVLVPFDDYTKISCDLEGNYFDLNLNGFMPLRFYKILFKVPMNDTDIYLDKNYIFKVVK